MSKEKVKYSRYLKSAEDSLKKALLVDNYANRSFTITTKISKSAKYPVRNPIKIINGANYESDWVKRATFPTLGKLKKSLALFGRV